MYPHFWRLLPLIPGASPVAQWLKNQPALQELQEWWVQFLGQEDPLEEGMATYSCPDNPMDRGAWRTAVHRVTKSLTGLKRVSTHTCLQFLNLSEIMV